jgi:hypothetical protein
MDILVRPDSENAQHILHALEEFGMGSMDLAEEDFSAPDRVIQIGVAPIRVDMMTSLTGVSWEEAASGRVAGHYGDLEVYYLGREQFILNKRILGRKKDLADLEAIGEE